MENGGDWLKMEKKITRKRRKVLKLYGVVEGREKQSEIKKKQVSRGK